MLYAVKTKKKILINSFSLFSICRIIKKKKIANS
jgi:hypothetical protein